MKRQAFQHPELRDANDNIIQEGTYGKASPLVNGDNTGVLDYINNNLEALHDNINGSRIYVASKAALPTTGDLSAMYIAEDTGKWYLWDGTKYIETDNARKIADEAIAARDAAKASATAAANSAREQQADWNVTDTTSKAFVKNKPDVYPKAHILDSQLPLGNRLPSINVSYGDASLHYFCATSAITDGSKPPVDAQVLHLSWDNPSNRDAQLAIGNENTTLYLRTQQMKGEWSKWRRAVFDTDTIARAIGDEKGYNISSNYAKKSDLSTSVSTTSLTVTGQTSVPTANAGNSSKAIANTEFVAKSISALVNGAPDQLNTLNELAKALGNNANFASTVTAELAKKLNSTEAESTYATKQEARVLPGTVTAFSGTFKDGYPVNKNTGLVNKEWHLCDGTNGTPDLRNRFIYGGDGTNNRATGGEESHKLTEAELPKIKGDAQFRLANGSTNIVGDMKNDASQSGVFSFVPNSGSKWNSTMQLGPSATANTDVLHLAFGGDQPHNNMPPYYTLAYIMKL